MAHSPWETVPGFLLVTCSCRVEETFFSSVQLHRSTGKKMEAQIRKVTCYKVTCSPSVRWCPTPASSLHQLGDLHFPRVKGSVPQDTIQTPIPSHLYFCPVGYKSGFHGPSFARTAHRTQGNTNLCLSVYYIIRGMMKSTDEEVHRARSEEELVELPCPLQGCLPPSNLEAL